ncbi:unnamed protein product [Bemisia tabaci]|uniref:Uncharacterized protein n=1 Tax=Bemisia tabaci TaxID=7038 RepID=A0A9P0CEU4_BEMTA|nr:unnamed protein product [Bemisia tabaci]
MNPSVIFDGRVIYESQPLFPLVGLLYCLESKELFYCHFIFTPEVVYRSLEIDLYPGKEGTYNKRREERVRCTNFPAGEYGELNYACKLLVLDLWSSVTWCR